MNGVFFLGGTRQAASRGESGGAPARVSGLRKEFQPGFKESFQN